MQFVSKEFAEEILLIDNGQGIGIREIEGCLLSAMVMIVVVLVISNFELWIIVFIVCFFKWVEELYINSSLTNYGTGLKYQPF